MRIGIVRDVSQVHRKWLEEAIAESTYQKETVKEMGRILSRKYDVIHYVYDEELVGKLKEDKIDLVFNLANGYHNPQDRGELPALLDRYKIPYTGSSALGHGICDDKGMTSMLLEKYQIRTPKTFMLSSIHELDRHTFTYPLLIKPNNEGSGRGISNKSLVYTEKDLYLVVHQALNDYAPPILVTEYIDGAELTLGILGNGEDLTILPPLEIDFSNLPDGVEKIYSFEVKHEMEEDTNYYIPGRFSSEVLKEIEETGKSAYKLLELRDYARIDMRVRDGKAYILEINSLAGLNPHSSDIVKTAHYKGISYPDLLEKILQGAMKRYGIEMTPKDKPEVIKKIREMRQEENKIAHEEEVQIYREAGNLPLEEDKEQESEQDKEEKEQIEVLLDQIQALEFDFSRMEDQLGLIRKLIESMGQGEKKFDRN